MMFESNKVLKSAFILLVSLIVGCVTLYGGVQPPDFEGPVYLVNPQGDTVAGFSFITDALDDSRLDSGWSIEVDYGDYGPIYIDTSGITIASTGYNPNDLPSIESDSGSPAVDIDYNEDENITIEGFEITDGDDSSRQGTGIYTDSGYYNILSDNKITGNLKGIWFDYGDKSLVKGNDITDNDRGISVDWSWDDLYVNNNFHNNEVGFYQEDSVYYSQGQKLFFNSFKDNTQAAIENKWTQTHDDGGYVTGDNSRIDATLNWWGSPDGPTADFDKDSSDEYAGGGGTVLGDVAISPWLKDGTDSSTSLGFQPDFPLTYVVDDVGPEPGQLDLGNWISQYPGSLPFSISNLSDPVIDAGYLNRAVFASNAIPGKDRIEVRNGPYSKTGTYSLTEPISDSVELVGKGNPTIKLADSPTTYKIPDESPYTYEAVIFAFGGNPTHSGGNIEVTGSGVSEVDISGFIVDAGLTTPVDRSAGILLRNVEGLVSNNIVKANPTGGSETFGILSYGDSSLQIVGNEISRYVRGGIGVNGQAAFANITDNVVTGPGDSVEAEDWAPNGIQMGYGASGTVTYNTVTGNGWPGEDWAGTGIMVVDTSEVQVSHNSVRNNEAGISVTDFPGMVYGTTWSGVVSNITVDHNDLVNNEWSLAVLNDSTNVEILNNYFRGTEGDNIGVYSYEIFFPSYDIPFPDNVDIHYNSIKGSGGDGLWVGPNATGTVDATLNYWGSSDGPTVNWTTTSNTDYNGGGDEIVGPINSVYYSPWISGPDADPNNPGIQIDTEPDTPGVQLPETVNIIVDDVGPVPTTENGNQGYLNQAIWGSNQLRGRDIINVRVGDKPYDVSENIIDPVLLQGPNSGVPGYSNNRGDEAILGAIDLRYPTDITPNGITVEGFRIEGDNGQASINANGTGDNLTIKNNVIVTQELQYGIINGVQNPNSNAVRKGWKIISNEIVGPAGEYNTALNLWNLDDLLIKGNLIRDTGRGIQLDTNNDVIISGNIITNTIRKGIQIANSPEVNVLIEGNTITNTVTSQTSDEGAVTIYPNSTDIRLIRNVLKNNYRGFSVCEDKDGVVQDVVLHYNSITGNTDYGVANLAKDGGIVNATLNWWGDSSGPSGKGEGSGDAVSDNVIFSPWLGINPDADPDAVGVQLKSPMAFIVDDVGPALESGYLNPAIVASNDQTHFPGTDTVKVHKGTYDITTPITDSVEITSKPGPPSEFVLNGDVSINAPGVIIGGQGQGFRVNDNVTIGSEVTGSGTVILLRRNSLLGQLTHNGTGTVDALFNYWGSRPDISGNTDQILVTPWLDEQPGSSPMTYGVDDLGKEPKDGYLETALQVANNDAVINIYSDEGDDDYHIITKENIGPKIRIITGGSSLEFHKNIISGPVVHQGKETADFSLNYWGSPPNVEGKENLILTPWLQDLPGTPNMTYQVAPVGADYKGGVTRAVVDANKDSDQDTILVNHGTYNAPNDITHPVTLLSEEGSATHTFLAGDISIESSSVILGQEGKGFTVNGDVAIVTGTDAEDWNIQVNRNILLGSLTHDGAGIVNALFNNWGDDGPTVNGNEEDVLYSPWLFNVPGTKNMTYIVDDVGANPGDSLNRAISDANTDTNKDTIIVNHGTYTASSDQPVNQSVKIVSVMGSPANTFIGGDSLNIDASEVQVGKRSGYVSRGFTINSNINIGSGADASTIYINWNNINGTVTNKGSGTLHAEYNWWGDTNPSNDTVGDVNYDPWLPDKVGNVLEYMDEHDLSDPRDAIAGMVAANLSSSQRAVSQLAAMGIDPDDAHNLLHSYGLRRTMNAVSNADSSGKFIQLLGGYRLPAGASGGLTNNIVAGGAGSVGGKTVGAVFTIGETIEVAFPLADFEGNPAKDLHPTVSLVKLDEDGDLQELVKVTSATYEEDSSAYVATFTTTGLQPGYYQVQIDLPDLSSLSQVIELKGKEA